MKTAISPVVSADLPGLPGVPAQIGPIRCPDCGERRATVHHGLAAAADPAGNCEACWHLWPLHGSAGCDAKVYPAHSLTGEPCPCERTAAPGPDGAYQPRLSCPACGSIFELEATAYAVGLAAGVLAEMARRSADGACAEHLIIGCEDCAPGQPCPECGSLLAYSHNDGCGRA